MDACGGPNERSTLCDYLCDSEAKAATFVCGGAGMPETRAGRRMRKQIRTTKICVSTIIVLLMHLVPRNELTIIGAGLSTRMHFDRSSARSLVNLLGLPSGRMQSHAGGRRPQREREWSNCTPPGTTFGVTSKVVHSHKSISCAGL